MFTGEELVPTSFQVLRVLPAKRVRAIAEVNGVPCFVKTFGDPIVQCAADELKRLAGLQAVGVCRAKVPVYGDVLIAHLWQHNDHLGHHVPTPEIARKTLPILMFDVVIANNDRTDTNILLLPGGDLLPIDESAAFKKPSTCRMRKWTKAVLEAARGVEPMVFESLATPPMVAATLRRCGYGRWGSESLAIAERARRLPELWQAFLLGAERSLQKRALC